VLDSIYQKKTYQRVDLCPEKYDTPWINEESKTALIKKRKLWKKYKYNRNLQNKKKYEEARNEANRLVRKAKYEYECSIAINMKEDSKIFF
jgi:hypothetical protein